MIKRWGIILKYFCMSRISCSISLEILIYLNCWFFAFSSFAKKNCSRFEKSGIIVGNIFKPSFRDRFIVNFVETEKKSSFFVILDSRFLIKYSTSAWYLVLYWFISANLSKSWLYSISNPNSKKFYSEWEHILSNISDRFKVFLRLSIVDLIK